MRQALNMIHFIVTDGGCSQMNGHTSPITNGDSGIGLDNIHPLASKALKDLEVYIKFSHGQIECFSVKFSGLLLVNLHSLNCPTEPLVSFIIH